MTAAGLGDIEKFPFIDPPDHRNIKDGVQLLEELGALDGKPKSGSRAGRRAAAHPAGPQALPAAGRPAAGPDGAGGRPQRLRPRGHGDRRGAVHPGPARAALGQAAAGRPAARPLQGRDERLPGVPEPVALRARAAEGAVLVRVPPDVPVGVPELPADTRVAGHLRAAAHGRQDDGHPASASRTRAPDHVHTSRCWPVCSRTSG